MPFEALSANASEIVPVGAMAVRWLLRIPCLRMRALIFSGSREANRGAARYFSASKRGKRPFSSASDRCGRIASVVRVVAKAEHQQRIRKTGETQADAPFRSGLLRLLGQRPDGRIEHIVQHAHG